MVMSNFVGAVNAKRKSALENIPFGLGSPEVKVRLDLKDLF